METLLRETYTEIEGMKEAPFNNICLDQEKQVYGCSKELCSHSERLK